MSVTKIENFGGEVPSASPRALPPDSAQVNNNLYLGIREFRPLRTDLAAATAPSGTKTLYRFTRKSDGSFNSDHTSGWIATTEKRRYVKGQINDERTERTYYTIEDGSARPRAIDVNGANRILGVPRPVTPVISANTVDEFTSEEADTFLYGDVSSQLQTAIKDAISVPTEPTGRYSGSTIYAGSYSNHGLLFPNNASVPASVSSQYWVLWGEITKARADAIGLDYSRLYAVESGGNVYVQIFALPYTVRLNESALTSALTAITAPTEEAPRVFSDEVIDNIIASVNDAIDPINYVKSDRDELDSLVKQFKELLYTGTVTTTPTRPTPPAKPTVGEYYVDENGNTVRDSAWVTYDEDYADYQAALETYNSVLSTISSQSGSINDRLATIQARAISLVQGIEQKIVKAWKDAAEKVTWARDLIDEQGGVATLLPETVERVITSRFYVATFVTDWGEESQPSEPTELIEVDQNDTVNIARPVVSTGESFAARNITKWRLYRTATGSQITTFQFVEEFPIATTTYIDEKKQDELGEVIVSAAWREPPYRSDEQFDGWPKPVVGSNPYLRGMTGMPNGIMAGFLDNTVAFCEPYHPYAWPVEYQISTEFPVVGLGVFGQTLFVGTTANPYFISGADSASMSAQKLDSNQACASADSIASVQGGVLYASPDGLCVADQNGVRLVSEGLYTREDWQALSPSTMFAIEHENIYYLFYNNGTKGCITFDMRNQKLGRCDLQADAAFVDRLTDTLYLANGTSITAVFRGTAYRTGVWKSIKFTLPDQQPMAWVRVLGDQNASSPVTLKWYGDGVLRYTVTLTSITPVRLPPGRYLEHEIEISSQARVTQVFMSSTTQELKSA